MLAVTEEGKMEKARLTDDEINGLAHRLLIPLTSEVNILDRHKVVGRMLEIQESHIDDMLATLRASKPVTEGVNNV